MLNGSYNQKALEQDDRRRRWSTDAVRRRIGCVRVSLIVTETLVADQPKRESDGLTHSKPNSIDQQSEDSFPTSDPPSFSPGATGAPHGETEQPKVHHHAVRAAERKVKTGNARKPEAY
jgi:hypothetical protein